MLNAATSSARRVRRDFIDFMQATGVPGMWTVSVNATAQSAAAAVAFFNGDVDDGRVIGVDRDGVDWGTVGSWAALREAGGNPDPHPHRSVGGRQRGVRRPTRAAVVTSARSSAGRTSGPATASSTSSATTSTTATSPFVRRCSRSTRASRSAPSGSAIRPPGADWGNEVIESAGERSRLLRRPRVRLRCLTDGDAAVRRPSTLWPETMADVANASTVDVPVAVTEYNLVSFEAGDTERTMTQAMNALYVADTIGQLAVERCRDREPVEPRQRNDVERNRLRDDQPRRRFAFSRSTRR